MTTEGPVHAFKEYNQMKRNPQLRLAPLLTAALAAFAAQNLAMAQSNSWVTESAIGAVPLDLEVTPNGKIAAVRANIPGNNGTSNQKLSFWRTDTGAQIGPAAVGSGNLPWVSASGKPLFSDAVAVTNDAAIAIGSAAIGAASENTTYVDILALTYPGGIPTVGLTQTHVLGGGTGAVSMAGEAHDVAITPDGALAVVSHRNWIHVFDMTSGDLMSEFNIGN